MISFARSAYFRVLTVWWYWPSAGDIVATMIVWELPLRPSLRIRVSLLQKPCHEISLQEAFKAQATVTVKIPITVRNICKALLLLFSQSIDAVCQSKKWTINVGSISKLLASTVCLRSPFTTQFKLIMFLTFYIGWKQMTGIMIADKSFKHLSTCQQDQLMQASHGELEHGIGFFAFFSQWFPKQHAICKTQPRRECKVPMVFPEGNHDIRKFLSIWVANPHMEFYIEVKEPRMRM